ncbi:hypothetical protein Y032_0013g2041 [Ancylostoma ceylanicum]|nr:hypothetical protein Y032_0013g2041 [Ancylostoma ceylanicum]
MNANTSETRSRLDSNTVERETPPTLSKSGIFSQSKSTSTMELQKRKKCSAKTCPEREVNVKHCATQLWISNGVEAVIGKDCDLPLKPLSLPECLF